MLDEIDRGLVHALRIDGRAPFSRIGAVLGVSTQTVARRYRRLMAAAGLRVAGLADPRHSGQSQWLARLTAAPRAAQDLAQALARRSDTSWVKLASGGTEIVAVIHPAPGDANSLLLHDIPRTSGITALSAHYLLHTYLGGPTSWRAQSSTLTPTQQEALTPTRSEIRGPVVSSREGAAVLDSDSALLAALGRDGRMSLAELAEATGWSAVTVGRRLAELQASGAIFFDVDVNPAVLGATTSAMLWMSVAPAHLDAVATALAQHDELAFVAATTGQTNLVGLALVPDPAALHEYLVRRLPAYESIRALETAPILRTVKSAAPFVTRSVRERTTVS
ncbi:Lrp/AsnC family transcriptional regulator [Kribbella monticola]|uniref:Lrp/AsnC family transcriptional regulator n=1 Tax=Kribbella monticola TaxID=2185285 RepID=UPI000DD44F72|nr:AsnC family transcriptional regulator [Kribbella monticola]